MKIGSITGIKYGMSQFLEKLSQNLENKGLVLSSKTSALDSAMLLSLALFPLLYMTLRSWTNSFVFILLILAIIYFINNPSAIKNNLYGKPSKWIIFNLSSAVLAIAISQSFRQDLSLTDFDDPSRILLTAIIFLYPKDTSSFYALMIAALTAQALRDQQPKAMNG